MSQEDSKKDTDSAKQDAPQIRPRRGCGGLFMLMMLVPAAICGGGLGAFVSILQDSKHTIQALEEFRPAIGSKVYSADEELLGEFAMQKCQVVSLHEVPLYLQKAFIATEDDKFYEHKGVRPLAIVNGLLYGLQRGRMRGGSTISQQVVRIVEPLGIGQDRDLGRKLREAITALQVERDFTKDEILELYLNLVFLGVSANGVQAASQQYYAKDCWDISLGEAALLAGLPRAPNPNQPFRSPENARERRNIVLKQMLDNQFITQEQYEAAVAESVEESVITPEERAKLAAEGKGIWTPDKYKAPYFVEEIRQFIYSQKNKEEVLYEGLEIHTTVDMRLQQAAEDVLLGALDDFDAKKLAALKKQGKENEFVPVTGALICLDNRAGYKGFVRAMVGGRNFETEKFNCATQALRQPGSSIKPFVWAAAIANGWTPSTIEVDAPYVRVDPWGNRWSPKNFSGDFAGPVTLRVALEKSINIVSVKLVEKLTMPLVRSYLQRAGITTPINNAVGLTIALGTPEVKVIDHCVAYSTFANLGVKYPPILITEIKNRDGITVYDYRSDVKERPEQAMDPNAAFVMTYLMKGVAEYGTGARSKALGRPRAGKTGTANESRDVWFCGFTPHYTCVVWMGYADHRPLGRGKDYTGGRLACPVWTEFMKVAEEGLPVRDFDPPEGIDWYDVDKTTGVLGGSFREAFLKGTAPPAEVYVPMEEAQFEEEGTALLETL